MDSERLVRMSCIDPGKREWWVDQHGSVESKTQGWLKDPLWGVREREA